MSEAVTVGDHWQQQRWFKSNSNKRKKHKKRRGEIIKLMSRFTFECVGICFTTYYYYYLSTLLALCFVFVCDITCINIGYGFIPPGFLSCMVFRFQFGWRLCLN
jgi:hypothetical protein